VTRKASFPPVVDARTRVLVLGSLPGERSLAERRYYAHPQNQFWRLVGGAIGADLAALPYDQRLAALLARGIGLWDVVASARRTGSGDAAIAEATANDLPGLIDRLPHLRAVAFNGGKAAAIGRPLLAGRPLALLALPSSSPLHTIGLAAKQPAWMALADYLAD
jgi:hypoxanthine-DNA glycosylase